MKKVYIAGPAVFAPVEIMKSIAAGKHELCARYGFEGIFPMDKPLDLTKLTPAEAAYAIYRNDIELLDACDLMIADLTQFRGASGDAGTIFELGLMAARHPDGIAAYTLDRREYILRVRDMGFADRDSFRDHDDNAIENWGGLDNLMLTGSMRQADGSSRFVSVPGDPRNVQSHLDGFEACLKFFA